MHSSDHAADLIDTRDCCLVDAVTERCIISDPNNTSDICMSGNTSGYSDIGDLSTICYAEEPLIISRSCYRQITDRISIAIELSFKRSLAGSNRDPRAS